MVDIKHKRLPLTHDGYLKLYQLRKPQISTKEYDVILIDEAQDLTPGETTHCTPHKSQYHELALCLPVNYYANSLNFSSKVILLGKAICDLSMITVFSLLEPPAVKQIFGRGAVLLRYQGY